MKNVTAFLLIAFAATASNAEVINLECKGENAMERNIRELLPMTPSQAGPQTGQV